MSAIHVEDVVVNQNDRGWWVLNAGAPVSSDTFSVQFQAGPFEF